MQSWSAAKIAKGLKYNEGMGRSNLLKVVLSIIYCKHKATIAEIKQAAARLPTPCTLYNAMLCLM